MIDQLLDNDVDQTVSLSSSDLRNLVAYAANLYIAEELTERGVVKRLVALGYSEELSYKISEMSKKAVNEARQSKAVKNIVIGGIFLVLGLVLTFAEIGFIFWGAIVFGGIQFVKGLIELGNKLD